MSSNNTPKHIKFIQNHVTEKLKLIKKPTCELLETKQVYCDQFLEIYREAFNSLIDNTITYSSILREIKDAYENSINIRNERISQFIVQDMTPVIYSRGQLIRDMQDSEEQ